MKENIKKIIKSGFAIVLVLSLSITLAIPAYAGQWIYDNSKSSWWYQRDDRSYPAGKWEQINNVWYYFWDDGYMAENTWVPDGYYVDGSGAWVMNYQISNNSASSEGTGENMNLNGSFTKLPETMDEFMSLPQISMSTPQDTVALLVLALAVYPKNNELSLQMVDVLRGPRPMTGMDRQFIADRFRDKDYVPRSYFKGATPQNDYTPDMPLTIEVLEQSTSYDQESMAKLFIQSGGADSTRPVTVRLAKDGKWYAWEYSSVLLGIRQPESDNPWQ